MNVIKKSLLFILFAAGAGLLAWNYVSVPIPPQWTEREARLIQSLSLSALPELAPDPGNPVADSAAAAELGHRLYFDTRLSGGENVACATCHQPELMFTDGLTLAVGSGLGSRHTPSLVGLAHSPWFYWDGRKDSQWAQALEPLETSHEHDSDRTRISRLLTEDKTYAAMYGEVFGELPVLPDQPRSASPLGNARQQAAWHAMTESERRAISEVFANVGKALAAYQRKLLPGSTRFDDYADAISLDRATGQDRAARQEDRVTRQDCVSPRRTAPPGRTAPPSRTVPPSRKNRSRPARSRDCGCLSARHSASTATTGRCSPTMSFITPVCSPFRVSCRPWDVMTAFAWPGKIPSIAWVSLATQTPQIASSCVSPATTMNWWAPTRPLA